MDSPSLRSSPTPEPCSETENPYAPPQSSGPSDRSRAVLKSATRLYRGMGWAGVAYSLLVFSFAMATELTQREPQLLGPVAGMAVMCLTLTFFAYMVRVASRLESDFHRAYRPARWLAILAATIFSPLLTIPGILAIVRLERFRAMIGEAISSRATASAAPRPDWPESGPEPPHGDGDAGGCTRSRSGAGHNDHVV